MKITNQSIISLIMIIISLSFLGYKVVQTPVEALAPAITTQSNIKADGIAHLQENLSQITTLDHFLSWLDSEEKRVWAILEKALDITFEQLMHLKKNNYHEYETYLKKMVKDYASDKAISEKTKAEVIDIIKESGLDPDKITILAWNFSSTGAATDTILFINEEMFNNLSDKEKKFAIGHELIHVAKQDHSTNHFVQEARPHKGITDAQVKEALQSLEQFQEIRADILASCKGAQYAEGNKAYFTNFMQEFGDQPSPSHPKNSTRIAIGTTIAQLHALA